MYEITETVFVSKECIVLKKTRNIIAAALCAVMFSGCFGSPETTTVVSQTTSQAAVSAASQSSAVKTKASETTDADNTVISTQTVALAGIGDTPAVTDGERPLVIAVDGLNKSWSPFAAEETAADELMRKLTGVTLIGRTRSGDLVRSGRITDSEEYEGTKYSYRCISDSASDYDSVSDTTSFTFALRNDVHFADGEELDADDVIFTMYLHLDPSYNSSVQLQDTNIIGALNYRFDSSTAGNITQEQIDRAFASEDIKPLIREQITLPTLRTQFANVKSFYGDTAYSVYTNKYPKATDLFTFFYSIDSNYSSKGKDEQTVINDIANMYGSNYKLLASMIFGDETLFDEQAVNIAVGLISRTSSGSEDPDHVGMISGIVKNNKYAVTVTVKGDGAALEKALSKMVILPLHYYGSASMFSYENDRFGFAKGLASHITESDKPLLGAGPYTVVGTDTDGVLLKANEYYYKGAPASPAVKIINGRPDEAASLIADGTADICVSDSSGTSYAAVGEANRTTETIYAVSKTVEGYGYIGINAGTVRLGDNFSNRSYALRKALATAIAYYKPESLDTYFGGCGIPTDYPYLEGVDVTQAAADSVKPYSVDNNGAALFAPGADENTRREAVKSACLGFLREAGYAVADGKVTAAPSDGKLEYTAMIAANGTGDHPSYIALKKASELLGEIGITLTVKDITDASELYRNQKEGTVEIWAGAWNSETLSDVYIDSCYGLNGSTKLKYLIREAEATDPSARPEAFMKCYDKIVNAYAAEIPMYRRINSTLFSALRLDVTTIPPDMTDSYGWADEVYLIKQR